MRIKEALREVAQDEVPSASTPPNLEDLYQRFHKQLYRFSLYLVRDEGFAEDLMQEAFLSFYSHGIVVDGPENAYAWLCTAIRNRARNHWRDRKGQASQPQDETLFDRVADTSRNQEEAVIRKQHLDRLQQFVEELEGIDKACILLYAQGMTFKKIAEELGVSLSTAINKTMRAIKLMNRRASQK